MTTAKKNSAIILLVDDDEDDQIATKRFFSKGKLENKLYIVDDGEEALDYLHHRGKYKDLESSPIPDLILLDLNMPKLDGREVLSRISKDEKLRRIPVIVFTTSSQEEDVVKSYELGCSSYITKPVGSENFSKVVKLVEQYWFDLVILPPKV